MCFLPEGSTPLSAARGVMKKNPAPRSAFILFAIRRANGIPKTSARSFGIFSTRASKDRKAFAFFRARTPGGRAQPHDRADLLSRRTFAWRKSSMDQVPHALARVHSVHRRDSLRGGYRSKDY